MSQDSKQAAAWYQPSAEQGLGPAQINLGVLYANGRGVRRDGVVAYVLWSLAAEEGISLEIDNLRDIDGGLLPGFVF